MTKTDLLAFLRGSAPRDATKTPERKPQPTIGAPTGTRVPAKQKGLLAALLRSAEPSEDTPLGMLNEYLNPIRQGAVARELVGSAAQAVGRGELGRAAGMGAMAAMAVPGVPGNPRAANVAEDLIDVGGVMRPRLNSLGQPIHPTEEGIRNFWKWFGESKTVDEAGRPLVRYKGMYPYDYNTPGEPPIEVIQRPSDFPAFNRGEKGVQVAGFFGDEDVANRFANSAEAGRSVFPVYLRSRNPWEIDAAGEMAGNVQFGPQGMPFREAMRGGRYDSAIIKNTADEGTINVVRDPRDIKSAIGNTGAFDPSDPRITRSIAALLGAGAAMRQPNRQK